MLGPMPGGDEGRTLSRADAASLLAWWLEAGVDVAVQEEPRDWRQASRSPGNLGELSAQPTEGAAPAALENTPSAPSGHLPQVPEGGATAYDTLDAFHAWLAESAELPLFRAGAGRALPHGPAQAEIMLVSGVPADEDIADGQPIGGPAWQLTVRMLAAIGFKPSQAYVAAISCFSGGGTRLSEADMGRCRDSLAQQIALVAPKRLLLLGDLPARLLAGAPLLSARGKVHRIGKVPAVATFHPRFLLERPAEKASAWRDLLLLMGEPL